jgi:hypothetical protein
MTHVKQPSQYPAHQAHPSAKAYGKQSGKQSGKQPDMQTGQTGKLATNLAKTTATSAANGSLTKLSANPAASPQGRLSTEKLGQLVLLERQHQQQAVFRAQRRQPAAPTVQMSVRMNEDVYRRFRALCKLERRTNGEMLHDLIEVYLDGC